MRCYGKNRARMLGEKVAGQKRANPVELKLCRMCGKKLPLSQFGGGQYVNCNLCRLRNTMHTHDMRARRSEED